MDAKVFRSSLKTYLMGFLLAVVLTVAAFLLVSMDIFGPTVTIAIILLLAIAQLVVQLIFFLHLGKEERPKWNLIVFGFATVVLLIIVVGSLWIMDNLNYNMMTMPADEKDQYMLEQSNKGF